jgi:hypothetical protein
MTIGSLTTLAGTIVANYVVVNQYLYDYEGVWTWLTVINVAGLAITVFVAKETIHQDKRETFTFKSVLFIVL